MVVLPSGRRILSNRRVGRPTKDYEAVPPADFLFRMTEKSTEALLPRRLYGVHPSPGRSPGQ
jgi:hypothetical protein